MVLEVLVASLFSLIGGFWLGVKLSSRAAAPILTDKDRTQAIDRANYLRVLRRELANVLIWRDPQRYLALHERLVFETKSLESWRIEEIERRLSELSVKYPFYDDFDIFGFREYILYADGIWQSYDELEIAYIDFVMFEALSVLGDPAWKGAAARGFIHKFSLQDSKHLLDYVGMIDDTKLQFRIDQAMEAYYALGDPETLTLDNDWCCVKAIYSPSPDNQYGIHLKATDDYAVYSVFMYDSGKVTHSFYRSNSTFDTTDLIIGTSYGLLAEFDRYMELSCKVNSRKKRN